MLRNHAGRQQCTKSPLTRNAVTSTKEKDFSILTVTKLRGGCLASAYLPMFTVFNSERKIACFCFPLALNQSGVRGSPCRLCVSRAPLRSSFPQASHHIFPWEHLSANFVALAFPSMIVAFCRYFFPQRFSGLRAKDSRLSLGRKNTFNLHGHISCIAITALYQAVTPHAFYLSRQGRGHIICNHSPSLTTSAYSFEYH